MAFVELRPGVANYDIFLGRFAEARRQMDERYGDAHGDGAAFRHIEIAGTKFTRVSPRPTALHMKQYALEQADSGLQMTYMLGQACFDSPKRPSAHHSKWQTCFAIEEEMDPETQHKGALRLFQMGETQGNPINAHNIYVERVFTKGAPHLTMLLGDVDRDGTDDLFLIAADGSAKLFLGNSRVLTDPENGGGVFLSVDVFKSPLKIPQEKPAATAIKGAVRQPIPVDFGHTLAPPARFTIERKPDYFVKIEGGHLDRREALPEGSLRELLQGYSTALDTQIYMTFRDAPGRFDWPVIKGGRLHLTARIRRKGCNIEAVEFSFRSSGDMIPCPSDYEGNGVTKAAAEEAMLQLASVEDIKKKTLSNEEIWRYFGVLNEVSIAFTMPIPDISYAIDEGEK